MLRQETKLPILRSEDPYTAVVHGAGNALDNISLLREVAREFELRLEGASYEEIARADVSTAIWCQLTYNGPPRGIAHLGHESLQERWLPEVADGEALSAPLHSFGNAYGTHIGPMPFASLSGRRFPFLPFAIES